jgi:hypothetical protein
VRGQWRSRHYRSLELRSEPMSLVNIELYRPFVPHFQQQRLAVLLIPDIYALHNLESLQRLFTKSN